MAITDPTILEHYRTVRIDTGSTSANLPEADFLSFYNRARKDVLNKMRTLSDYYLYTEWVDDLVEDQIEYTLPEYRTFPGGFVPRCSEVISVAVKYGDDEKYEMLPRIGINRPLDIEEARKSGHGYTLMDRSIFIFPCADKNISGGIKLYGRYDPHNLTEGSEEKEILIPADQYEILVIMTKIRVYESRKLWNERQTMMNDAVTHWNQYRSNFVRNKGVAVRQEPNYNRFQ